MENLFITASRQQFRFQTIRGRLVVEDLWDLPLTVLDEARRALGKELKESDDDSLLSKKDTGSTEAEAKRAILKFVIETRQAEAVVAKDKASRRTQAARVRELIAQKQDAELAGKNTDELNALLAELEG